MRFISFACRTCLVSAVFVSSVLSVQAESKIIQIETIDGRTLRGEVDARSDAAALWLRRTEGNVILAVNARWADISAAEIDGESAEVAVLKSHFKQWATAAPTAFLTEFEPLQLTSHAVPMTAESLRSRVMSIEVDARIVNLDRTVESDGLLVALAAIDNHGAAVPVRGSLSARLIVERLDQHTGAVSFEEFQRWSAPVSVADFHEGVAELPLRYRRQSPEFRWDLCTAALLNVRLGVAGQGNFEASVPIAIQEFNPIRDEMRNQQGYRFFRNELTHETRQDGPQQLHRGYSVPRGYGY